MVPITKATTCCSRAEKINEQRNDGSNLNSGDMYGGFVLYRARQSTSLLWTRTSTRAAGTSPSSGATASARALRVALLLCASTEAAIATAAGTDGGPHSPADGVHNGTHNGTHGHDEHGGQTHVEKHIVALTSFTVGLLLVTMALEILREKLDHMMEHRAQHTIMWRHMLHLMQAMYKELSTLGIVSFGMFALEQTHWFHHILLNLMKLNYKITNSSGVNYSDEQLKEKQQAYVHMFELVHMGMFSIATLYIMLVVALMSNAKITASRWYRWEKNIEYFPNESLEAALKRTSMMRRAEHVKKSWLCCRCRKQAQKEVFLIRSNLFRRRRDALYASMNGTLAGRSKSLLAEELMNILFKQSSSLVHLNWPVWVFFAVSLILNCVRIRVLGWHLSSVEALGLAFVCSLGALAVLLAILFSSRRGMRLIAQWHIEDENQADYPVDQPQDIYTQLSRESSAAGGLRLSIGAKLLAAISDIVSRVVHPMNDSFGSLRSSLVPGKSRPVGEPEVSKAMFPLGSPAATSLVFQILLMWQVVFVLGGIYWYQSVTNDETATDKFDEEELDCAQGFKCRLTILAAIMLPPFLHVFVIGPTALEAHCTLLHAHLDEIKSIESFESRYTSRWIPMNDVASHGGPGERTSFPVDSSPNCSPRNQ